MNKCHALCRQAMFNSPMVMSNDLPNIDKASKTLLLNKEIIVRAPVQL